MEFSFIIFFYLYLKRLLKKYKKYSNRIKIVGFYKLIFKKFMEFANRAWKEITHVIIKQRSESF